jgi:hypothetical protein
LIRTGVPLAVRRRGGLLGAATVLAAGIMSGSAATAVPASGATAATSASTGTLPLLPDGLNGHLLFSDTTGTADWSSLTTLLKAAISGARVGNPAGNTLLIQLHLDRGGDNAAATDFLDHMRAAGVQFDVIGLSYYPWYHGPMSAMKANLTALIHRYHKYVSGRQRADGRALRS